MEIIRFENVKKTFTDGHEEIEALRETSFKINSGELVAVIGPSGSGKSTLLTIMGGLQSPTQGKVFFEDKEITALKERDRNKLRFKDIGFILQTSNLVPFLTVEEQFMLVDKYGKIKYRKEWAEELMKNMDIYKRRKLYPSELSGGEKQRAAICRALYTEPRLLLADEPTSSLDTEKAISVVKLLSEKTKNTDRSTVMVTHDRRLLKYCDKVFEIVDGNLKEADENSYKS